MLGFSKMKSWQWNAEIMPREDDVQMISLRHWVLKSFSLKQISRLKKKKLRLLKWGNNFTFSGHLNDLLLEIGGKLKFLIRKISRFKNYMVKNFISNFWILIVQRICYIYFCNGEWRLSYFLPLIFMSEIKYF